MSDYLPHRSENLATWFANYVDVLTRHAAALDLNPEDIAPLASTCAELDAAIGDQVAKKSAAEAATALKTMKHKESNDRIRAMTRRISANPAMTDALRQELGLNVADTVRTPNAGAGPEIPNVQLESLPGQVLVHFGTNPSNERRNSKPSWATGCLIFRKKNGESEYRMVGFQSGSPFVDKISGPGTDYSYIVRYQGRTASDLGASSPETTIAANGLLAA